MTIATLDRIVSEFSMVGSQVHADPLPRYNVAPTHGVPVIRAAGDAWRVDTLRWGLIPSWTRAQPAKPIINARIETLAHKPSFRASLRLRRCVIPASGFFEWNQSSNPKQPFHITRADGRLLALAGLWESWISPEGEVIETCAVITTPAGRPVNELHDRMPAILTSDSMAVWLDTGMQVPETALALLGKPPPDLVATAVSNRVNSPHNEGPECIEPVILPIQHKLFR